MRTFLPLTLKILILSIILPCQSNDFYENAFNENEEEQCGLFLSQFEHIAINKPITECKEIDESWYNTSVSNILKEEYNISYDEETGVYQSPNRANNIRFIYHNDGFTAKTRDRFSQTSNDKRQMSDLGRKMRNGKMEEEWEITFKVNGLETNSPYSPYSPYSTDLTKRELSVAGNRAFIENENIRIDYANNEEGMRQDFIIKKRPEGNGSLRLNLSAETKLIMTAGADALMFKDKNGEDKMKYSALKCWDANGRELRAFFEKNKFQVTSYELRDKSKIQNLKSKIKDQKSFAIVVNDEDAVYPITIDPLSTSPSWTAESNQANANLGYGVSTAGDINGDGYSDVIVGVPYFDNGQTNEGRTYLYYGSASGLSVSPDWTEEINVLNAQFGFSVSTAGDVNGDGFSDVIIGASYYENGEVLEGGAFMYLGSSAGLSDTANWFDESNQAYAQFGHSISTAGDVNGDGYSDVIVGTPNFDKSEKNVGKVFLYFGSASGLSVTEDWSAETNQYTAYFGFSVSTAGDVNADGYSDVIIGAQNFANGQISEGKAFVYHGSQTGLSDSADWTAEGDQAGAWFGYSVKTAGDVNGDGYSDVIVGAPLFNNSYSNEGRAFVYYGSANGLSETSDWIAENGQPDGNFGFRVSTAGDINGDGYSDVIVSAPYFDNGQVNEGKVFAYFGSGDGLSVTANWSAESNQAESNFGFSVSIAGDINGDGYSDVIVGSPNYNVGFANVGRAYVYNGSASGLQTSAGWSSEGDQASAFFGGSVSVAGDVNRDGYSDVIIGAPYFDNGQTDEGRVYVYHGSASGLSSTANWTAERNQQDALFGISVATAGDVNGDGYSDVIIGAYLFDNGQTNEGRAFVYNGSVSGLSANPDWTGESNQQDAYFGSSVSTSGDVNGDGYSDVIVGALSFDNGQADEGRAFVYHGSEMGLSKTSNWTAECDQIGAEFGCSVSTGGDVNGDGFSDVIVGAHLYNNGQADEGRTYVYHGSVSGLSMTANWTAESDQANATFGNSVSTAGDINGDGYSDVVVGAQLYDNGQTNEGRAFVYNGSESGLSASSNWTAESNQLDGRFGNSVSGAGDVNGDGYSDLIVGSQLYNNGQSDEGRAFVYHGSVSGLSMTANWTAESNQVNAVFGNSVSTAGDVNGDGYSDVIVGSHFYDNGQTDEGKVYVYYGNSGTGITSNVKQFRPGTNIAVYSGGLTGTNGQVRLNIFGKSPLGRADGKIVYEYKTNGIPFSQGTSITNSVSASGSGNNTDLGFTISGVQLFSDLTGLDVINEHKWRARVQYNLVNNPYQKFGPWRYYNNYIPTPLGNFKAHAVPPSEKQLTINFFIQGFYNPESNTMISDTAMVFLRNYISPYAIIDSAKVYLDSNGSASMAFSGSEITNNTLYYIQLTHRNSIETWNKASVFTSSLQNFDFSISEDQAFGSNMIQVDASPVRFAIYSGDVNQNGNVDVGDLGMIDNDVYNFTTGYVNTDVNGDNVTDVLDLSITDNNAYSFVSKITPP